MKPIEIKRVILTATASSLLALGAPGIASAAHHGKLHHGHHPGSHARHGKRAHLVKFGATLTSDSTGGSTGTSVNPTATPPVNSTPSSETAGTVASFANGVLTITLSNGSPVSGQVTDATDLRCQPASPPANASGGDQGDADDVAAESGDQGASAQSASDGEHGNHSDQGDGGESQDVEGNDEHSAQSCGTAALVAGAVVREAELSISGTGNVWTRVDLVQ